MPEPDPRVYFAAERTLLAWLRTGVAVMGLGFVIARFGLFLRFIDPAHQNNDRDTFSAVVGTGIVLIGTLCTALAGVQFGVFLKTLSPGDKPRPALTAPVALLLAFLLSVAGLVLSVYFLN